jgi:hypothetical protein
LSLFFTVIAGLSVDELCREGGSGLAVELPLVTSPVGVAVPLLDNGVFVGLSFTPSRVENIRVNRFVIEGFSTTGFDDAAEGSRWGAVEPLAVWLSSILGAALPSWRVVALVPERPEMEEAADPAGDGSGFSD